MRSMLKPVCFALTVLASVSATLGLQQWTGRFVVPAADKPVTPMHKLVTDIGNRLDGQITTTLGHAILCVEEIQALRKDWKTPARIAPAPSVKKAGG